MTIVSIASAVWLSKKEKRYLSKILHWQKSKRLHTEPVEEYLWGSFSEESNVAGIQEGTR